MDDQFKLAYQKLLAAKSVLLVGHVRPDIDALSSLGIMADLCLTLNKEFKMVVKEKGNAYYFLPYEDLIGETISSHFDLIIMLDCGSLKRTGIDNLKTYGDYLISIDHHLQVENVVDLDIRNSLAASTTEVLYDFFQANQLTITKTAANCFLSGSMADTDNFLYPSTSQKTLKIAAEMLDLGASYPKNSDRVSKNKNFIVVKIWSLALKNMKINETYKSVSTILPETEINNILDEFSLVREDAILSGVFGDIASFLCNFKAIKFALVINERDGMIAGNLRSADRDTNVATLAMFLGGGGHKKASGFVRAGKVENNRVILL